MAQSDVISRALRAAGALTLAGGIAIGGVASRAGADASTPSTLQAVSCVSDSFCVAVGAYGGHAAALEWTGAAWVSMTVPGKAVSELHDVICMSSTDCIAVGSKATKDFTLIPVIERWDGLHWKSVQSDQSGTESELFGIDCSTADQCVAVGYRTNHHQAGNPSRTMIQMWDGLRWRVVRSVDLGTSSTLARVSCVSSTSCLAVGSAESQHAQTVLAEAWDGTQWTDATPQNTNHSVSSFADVACPSVAVCMAVGSVTAGPLADERLGTDWQLTPVQQTPRVFGLTGVSCLSLTFCQASAGRSDYDVNAAFGWDGTSWHSESTPTPHPGGDEWRDVSCVSSTFCVAVGDYQVPGGNDSTFPTREAEMWNGASWSFVSLPA